MNPDVDEHILNSPDLPTHVNCMECVGRIKTSESILRLVGMKEGSEVLEIICKPCSDKEMT